MKQRNRCRNIFCVLIALLFVVGCFININKSKTVSWDPYSCQGQIQSEYDTDSHGVIVTDRLLPVDTLEKMDDYYSPRVIRKTGESIEETVYRITVWAMMFVVVLLLSLLSFESWICVGERRIHIFEVVSFIHRTDGKKKSCFDTYKTIKTGGQKNGSWYKI